MLPILRKERTTRHALGAYASKHIPMSPAMKKAAKKSATRKPVAKKVAKKKPAARAANKATVAKPAKKSAARKAAPVVARPKKTARPAPPAKRMENKAPLAAAPSKRAVKDQPMPLLREEPAPTFPSLPNAEQPVYAPPAPQRPEATYDPTPDTTPHQRGHTSIPHNAQSERAAALKGQRARIGGRRKY